MERSTCQCRDRWIEVAHQRVNVEIDASMSRSMDRSGTSTRQCRDRRVDVEIDGSKWHINASMSRSTRRCRDRWIEVAHQRVNVEINASMSRSMDRSHAGAIYRREAALKIGALSPEMQICWPRFPQLI